MFLFKLFNAEFSDFTNIAQVNDFLKNKFNIFSYEHRLFYRISSFTFKALNFKNGPSHLKYIATTEYLKESEIK